jgi:hypothetical protein
VLSHIKSHLSRLLVPYSPMNCAEGGKKTSSFQHRKPAPIWNLIGSQPKMALTTGQ